MDKRDSSNPDQVLEVELTLSLLLKKKKDAEEAKYSSKTFTEMLISY